MVEAITRNLYPASKKVAQICHLMQETCHLLCLYLPSYVLFLLVGVNLAIKEIFLI
jgi:hypothetical protein